MGRTILAPAEAATDAARSNAPSDKRRRLLFASTLLGLVAIAWLLHWITFGTAELGQDGYLSVDLGLSSWADMLSFTARDVHPPLFFAVLHWMFAAAGATYLVAKLLPIAGSVLSLVLTYCIGVRLIGPWAALAGAALLLFAVPDLFLAPTVRPFTLGLACSLSTLLLTLRLLQSAPGRRLPIALLILTTAAALLTWYLQCFFVALEVLLLWTGRQPRRPCGECAAKPTRNKSVGTAGLLPLAGGITLALPWYVYAAPQLAAKLRQGATVTEGTPALPSLGEAIAGLMQALLGRDHGLLTIAALLGWCVSLAIGVWCCVRQDRCRPAAWAGLARPSLATAFPSSPRALALGLLLGGLEVTLILLRWQHPDAAGRYLLGVLPFVALLQAMALTARLRQLRWPAAMALTVLLAGQLSWFLSLLAIPPYDYEHIPEASFLAAYQSSGDGLLFSDHAMRAGYLLNRQLRPHVPTAVVQTSGDRYLGTTPDHATAQVDTLAARSRRIWYLNTEPRPGRRQLGLEALAQRAYLVSQHHAGASDISLFLTDTPDRQQPIDLTLGRLVTLQAAAFTTKVTPGGGIAVRLVWRADQTLQSPYSVFVHLDAPSGQLIAQHDGAPAAGLRPTQDWQPGDIIDDRHGVLVPADTPAGDYRLDVGMYQVGGQRLALPDGSNAIQLGTVEVTR